MYKFLLGFSLLLLCSWVSSVTAVDKFSAVSANTVISLDFRNIAVRELIQFIAEAMKLNVIMSDSIRGNVSVHFRNITWEQSLDSLLELTGFVKKQKMNILFVATPAEFAARQKSQLEIAPIKIVHYQFRHTDVNVISNVLKNNPDLLSPFAKFSINSKTNSLWLKENVENLPCLLEYLHELDKAEPQLLITGKILNIDDDKVHELGVSINQTNLAKKQDLQITSPTHAATRLAIAIASVAQSQLLNLQLEALEASGHSKIIANPQVITQNRKTALIEAGEEIPYQESTSSGATSTSFKKAALSLKVTPLLLPDGRISLELEISQNKTSSLAVNGTPAIQTQVLKSEVVVRNHQTVVLGGIYEESTSDLSNKIPLIGSLPLLGPLLSQQEKHAVRKELFIFVTPEVLH